MYLFYVVNPFSYSGLECFTASTGRMHRVTLLYFKMPLVLLWVSGIFFFFCFTAIFLSVNVEVFKPRIMYYDHTYLSFCLFSQSIKSDDLSDKDETLFVIKYLTQNTINNMIAGRHINFWLKITERLICIQINVQRLTSWNGRLYTMCMYAIALRFLSFERRGPNHENRSRSIVLLPQTLQLAVHAGSFLLCATGHHWKPIVITLPTNSFCAGVASCTVYADVISSMHIWQR